ncbi:hypothetical protein IPG41_06850 [Candidatus Peregrinibacteria bacterium]|nr:MAG: hypothetical protein IPG41_06850 [Candidatus Peregrinibacteria bacterium]
MIDAMVDELIAEEYPKVLAAIENCDMSGQHMPVDEFMGNLKAIGISLKGIRLNEKNELVNGNTLLGSYSPALGQIYVERNFKAILTQMVDSYFEKDNLLGALYVLQSEGGYVGPKIQADLLHDLETKRLQSYSALSAVFSIRKQSYATHTASEAVAF